jgi:anti-sigma regulatory factor (Ser/Thr protein kinase)
MTATTGEAGTHRGQMNSTVAFPSNALMWPDGVPTGGSAVGVHAHTVLDGQLADPFSLEQLVHHARGDHPDADVAVVYPSRSGLPVPEDWVECCRAAAGDDRGQARRVFTGDTTPTSLRALRHWVADHASGSPDAVDDLVLATSELATNVERHARGWVTVDLVDIAGYVLVGVTDPAVDRLPVPRSVDSDEVSGRGLLVVAAVSSMWGIVVRPASKTVWAAIPA